MRYNTLTKLNRPIRFWGLSSLQFGLIAISGMIIILVLVFQRVNPMLFIMIIAGIVFGFSLLFANLKKEQKKGNPNYIQGLMIKDQTPKKIVDRGLFKNLITNGSFNSDNYI